MVWILAVLVWCAMAVWFIVRITQVVGIIVLAVIAAAMMGIASITLLISGIGFAGLYQLWGYNNAGWAAFVAGAMGFAIGVLLVRALIREIKTTPTRIRRWMRRD